MDNSNKKNLTYIIGFSLIIVAIIIIIIAVKNHKSNNTNDTAATTVAPISVVKESGNQDETIKGKLEFRDVKFGTSIKKIKAYEEKQDDTLGEPSQAESEDGYTYLNYSFNKDKVPSFWGAQVGSAETGAMLTYVFYNKKLIEVRLQYGSIGTSNYAGIVSSITAKFGNATYSRAYSNGSEDTWWKTDKYTMQALSQDDQIMVYYRQNR